VSIAAIVFLVGLTILLAALFLVVVAWWREDALLSRLPIGATRAEAAEALRGELGDAAVVLEQALTSKRAVDEGLATAIATVSQAPLGAPLRQGLAVDALLVVGALSPLLASLLAAADDIAALPAAVAGSAPYVAAVAAIPLAFDGIQQGARLSAMLVLIAGVVGAVLMSGVWRPGIDLTVHHVPVPLQDVVRTVLLVAMAALSLAITPRGLRGRMGFTWFPIVEVAKLFAGIFVAIVPVLAMLKAGTSGAFAPLIALVSTADGQPIPAVYFWLTGGLSSVLDNAPTYLVFFNLAGGDPQVLMGRDAATLLAISAGAVFMGAMTYIGNAPNFMVLAICKERGIPMPSFFGFVGWSAVFLLPVFVLLTVLFF
jgi:hypothetical protein